MRITRFLWSFIALFFIAFSLSGCTSMGLRAIPLEKLNAKYATGESRYMNVGDVLVHYRDEGEGPAILLIHGIVSSLHTWDGWTNELKKKYRVVRLDMPGFGLTGPAPSGNYNLEETMRFLEAFTTKLKLDKFVMVGNSLGGFFAWNYAYKHPDQISGLVLIDSAGYPQKTPWVVALASVPVAGQLGAVVTPRWLVSMNLKDVYADPKRLSQETIDRYFELILRPGVRGSSMAIFREMNRVSKDPNLGNEIKEIKTPTLLMWGAKDIWIPVSVLNERWRKDLPHAEVVVYDDLGHMPMEESPERSVKDMEVFLKTLNLTVPKQICVGE